MSFVDQRATGRDAKGMTAAVVIHAGLLAAVLLAPAAVQEMREARPFEAVNVLPLDPPPPPPEVRSEPDTPAPPAPPLLNPIPLVDVPQPPVDGPRTSPEPQPVPMPVPGITLGGTGTVIAPRVQPTPTPTPAPVLREAVRDPRYARNFQPDYPSNLLRQEVEGSATVRVLISPDGRVSRAEVVRASAPEFGEATRRQALAKWRFKPATEDGTPVPSWQTLMVRFTITP